MVQLHSHANIIGPQRGLVCHFTVTGNCDSHGKRRATSGERKSKNTTQAIANYTSPRDIFILLTFSFLKVLGKPQLNLISVAVP